MGGGGRARPPPTNPRLPCSQIGPDNALPPTASLRVSLRLVAACACAGAHADAADRLDAVHAELREVAPGVADTWKGAMDDLRDRV